MPVKVLNDKTIRRAVPKTGQVELRDKHTPGFGLRISSGGARTYFVMRRIGGKMVRRTIGKAHIAEGKLGDGELLLPDARTKAREILEAFERGIDPDVPEEPRTFTVIAGLYFGDASKKGGGNLRTRREEERKVRVELAQWNTQLISKITREDIEELVNAKVEISPVSANRLLARIKRIFRWAARTHDPKTHKPYISVNPAQYIDPPTVEAERERVLSMDELARIWRAADGLGYPFGPIIRLLILTAQRRSEVGEMAWAEVDGIAWRLPDARSKSGKGHLVPLAPRAVAILEAQPDVGELVFSTGRRQSAPGKEATAGPVMGWSKAKTRIDRLIAEAASKAGEEPLNMARHALPHWTLHDIRRSVATHLRDGDIMGADRVDRLVISKILNHAEGGLTRLYDRYSADPEQRLALEAWARVIERLVGLNVVELPGARA